MVDSPPRTGTREHTSRALPRAQTIACGAV